MLQSQSPLPKSVQVCYSVWSSATWNTPFQSFFATYMDLYTYIIVYIYTLNGVIYIYITYICGDEKSFHVSLNEDGAFSMSFVYALEAPNVCSSDVLPMFYRDVEAVEARTLFPPCLLKSSIWAKFLRLAISLSDSVDQKMCRAWHDWNLAGHR